MPKEINFNCRCPHWASMYKDVTAVLYGVDARLDEQPELIFRRRRVDAKDLVSQAGADLRKSRINIHPMLSKKQGKNRVCLNYYGTTKRNQNHDSRTIKALRMAKPSNNADYDDGVLKLG